MPIQKDCVPLYSDKCFIDMTTDNCMKQVHIITPVKDSIDLTLETARAVLASRWHVPVTYTIYNDFSTDENTRRLEEASQELGFELVNLRDITSHPSPNYTLESGVSLTVHNDASFVVSMDSVLNIYEHQSTYNPNMPLRELIYFVTIIKKLVENRNLFSHKLVKIPTPKFAVFYNGGETRPEREVLRLSDAYENQSDEPQLELMCTVYNINPGNNEDLKKRSQTLREYMIFVGYVNENLAKAKKSGKDYETAIRDAVNRCIAEDILKEFLLERGEDVQKIMMFDLTYEKQMENAKREWYNDGVEEGRAEGYSSGIAEGAVHHLVASVVKKVQKNKTLDQIADVRYREETCTRI